MVRVSVVIPSYNHRDYIVQAIESVLDQSLPGVECIVIDDGSTDGSVEVIQDLFKTRSGFQFVVNRNHGLLHSLNTGLSMARGEFFCELASDDFLPTDSLKKRVDYLDSHPEFVVVFGNCAEVLGKRITGEVIRKAKRRRMYDQADPIPDMLCKIRPIFCTGLIRREVLVKIGGFDEENFRYFEDLDTPVRLALAGRIGYLDAPVIFRRLHETNVSSTTEHIYLEKVRFYATLLHHPQMVPYRATLHRQLRRKLFALGRYIARHQGGNAEARQAFQLAWAYWWRDPRLLPYLWKWGRQGQRL